MADPTRRAYLLKERVEDVDQLRARDPDGRRGGSWSTPLIVDALVPAALGGAVAAGRAHPRERDVLREMAEGKNNAAIAATLSSRSIPWRR